MKELVYIQRVNYHNVETSFGYSLSLCVICEFGNTTTSFGSCRHYGNLQCYVNVHKIYLNLVYCILCGLYITRPL